VSEHDDADEVVDAELVDDHLPARRNTGLPAHPGTKNDPDAWLPPEVQEDVKAGIADATDRAYTADFEQFAAWCATVGRRPMPAAAQTVTHYISTLTRTPRAKTGRPYSPATLERIIAAIRTTHAAADQPIPETKGARKVVAGYRERLANAKDPAAAPRRVSPALPDIVRRALAPLDRTTLRGKRDAALLLLGFACAARASELVALDIDSVTTPPEVEGIGVKVKLYRRKVKKWQDITVKYGKDPDTCPVRAVRALIAALADEGHTAGPLFLRIDRWGYLAPPMYRGGRPIGDPSGRMTEEAASDVVEKAMARVGQPGRWRSHSLRRGFVTAARKAGADPVHTSRHGGWVDGSKAYQSYIEEDDGLGDDNPLTDIGL